MAKGKGSAAPFERPVASGELVDIRDLPAYKQKHGLRTVAASWPLVWDERANGFRRPAERNPRLIVEFIEPQTGQGTSDRPGVCILIPGPR